ncbi:SRPBCC family protein [Roseovarius sp.]|uniref:SRPBCC family protein n=1 Tax=Roseovarius sp. TaxID=1486281 RepID=UPI003BAB42FE
MAARKITVESKVDAPVETAWRAYTSPGDITQWNAASDDWHCPAATVDLREGGAFTSRMEARDGSMGFDFAGTYTKIRTNELIEYTFGDRSGRVEFLPDGAATRLRVTFDAETESTIEEQREGWQSILDSFRRHVEAK